MENDDKDRLPAEIYIRAFYKKYAGYLGIDTDEILAVYKPQSLKKSRSDTNKYHFGTLVTLKGKEGKRLSGITSTIFLAVTIALGGFLLYWVYKQYLVSSNLLNFF